MTFGSSGTGMENSIPDFREFPGIPGKFPGILRKISSPFSGTGMQMENSIPIFENGNASGKFHFRLSGRELEGGIPGNSRVREFSLTPVPVHSFDHHHHHGDHNCDHGEVEDDDGGCHHRSFKLAN